MRLVVARQLLRAKTKRTPFSGPIAYNESSERRCALRVHSSRHCDGREFCRRIGSSRRVTRQGHRQDSNRHDRTEDGICLEPPVEFARIPQIVLPDPVSHDDPSLRPVPSRSSVVLDTRGSVIWVTEHSEGSIPTLRTHATAPRAAASCNWSLSRSAISSTPPLLPSRAAAMGSASKATNSAFLRRADAQPEKRVAHRPISRFFDKARRAIIGAAL
jgi:hypothetical protein